MKKKIASLEELESCLKELISSFGKRQLLLLEGDLGAGKTQIVSSIAKLRSFSEEVHSPTFAICHSYKKEEELIDHIDLYRIKSLQELQETAFWDLFLKKQSWICVEWANKVPENLWPQDWPTCKISISLLSETEREIKIEKL